jgi:phenylalanyl-tRNA synthetase beta subunit
LIFIPASLYRKEKKSMAYRWFSRVTKKTLTDETVDKVLEQILSRLNSQLGAVLRR